MSVREIGNWAIYTHDTCVYSIQVSVYSAQVRILVLVASISFS